MIYEKKIILEVFESISIIRVLSKKRAVSLTPALAGFPATVESVCPVVDPRIAPKPRRRLIGLIDDGYIVRLVTFLRRIYLQPRVYVLEECSFYPFMWAQNLPSNKRGVPPFEKLTGVPISSILLVEQKSRIKFWAVSSAG